VVVQGPLGCKWKRTYKDNKNQKKREERGGTAPLNKKRGSEITNLERNLDGKKSRTSESTGETKVEFGKKGKNRNEGIQIQV